MFAVAMHIVFLYVYFAPYAFEKVKPYKFELILGPEPACFPSFGSLRPQNKALYEACLNLTLLALFLQQAMMPIHVFCNIPYRFYVRCCDTYRVFLRIVAHCPLCVRTC